MALDFSHYSIPPMANFAMRARSGDLLTDEMHRDAVLTLSPPLLPRRDMALLLAELDPTQARKRGRPVGNRLIRVQLARAVAAVTRPDLPIEVQKLLVDRLTSGKRFTDFQRHGAFNRKWKRWHQEILLCGLYITLREPLKAPGPLVHFILGPIDLEPHEKTGSPSERALLITHRLARTHYGIKPPSMGRLRNIVMRKSILKT